MGNDRKIEGNINNNGNGDINNNNNNKDDFITGQ